MSARNDASVDLTPATDTWESDGFSDDVTVDVAALYHSAAVKRAPLNSYVDVF